MEELRADPESADAALAPPGQENPPPSDASADAIESQIRAELRTVSYLAKEYSIDEIVRRYEEGATEELVGGELFVPSYQREFVWEVWRRSRFIESILMGLPIPQLLLAQELSGQDEDEGRLEIVDGSQRVRSLWSFVRGRYRLSGLTRLTTLNGKGFEDLLPSRQKKFLRTNIRVLELDERSLDEVTLEMFLRINQGSLGLEAAETRRGAYRGELYTNIIRLASDPLIAEMIPVQGTKAMRREREELVLRFLAYTFNLDDFKKPVAPFLEEFVKENQDHFLPEWEEKLREALSFAKKYLPNGFRKSNTSKTVPRVRFEALAVGIALALRKKPDLVPGAFDWLESEKFIRLTSSDGSNSAPRLKNRLFFVRDILLETAR
ncbi:MAG: DUF262 domain-containing protein [Armatimonadetes bacterium]|nr:DUF262 domain-containing protein [Armatimonadota bacterium]